VINNTSYTIITIVYVLNCNIHSVQNTKNGILTSIIRTVDELLPSALNSKGTPVNRDFQTHKYVDAGM